MSITATRTINVVVGEQLEQLELDGKVVKSRTYFAKPHEDPSAKVIRYCGVPHDITKEAATCTHPSDRITYEKVERGNKDSTRKINVKGLFEEKLPNGKYK